MQKGLEIEGRKQAVHALSQFSICYSHMCIMLVSAQPNVSAFAIFSALIEILICPTVSLIERFTLMMSSRLIL